MENLQENMLSLEQVQNMIASAVDEKAVSAFELRKQELDARENALSQAENLHTAQALLKSRGLPESLAKSMVNMTGEEMEAAVTEWENLFRAAVQQAVEDRLKGETPASGVLQDTASLSDADYYAQVYPHLV